MKGRIRRLKPLPHNEGTAHENETFVRKLLNS